MRTLFRGEFSLSYREVRYVNPVGEERHQPKPFAVPLRGSAEGEEKVMPLYLARYVIRFNSDSITLHEDVPTRKTWVWVERTV
jgi:hypothetical protein